MLIEANVSEAVDKALRLLRAAASLAVSLDRKRLGIAMAAKTAIIATTTMISTNVNPFFCMISALSGGSQKDKGIILIS